MLIGLGAIDESEVADILTMQTEKLPFASTAYVLGYADERMLITALGRQKGSPAIVLDESILNLNVVSLIEESIAFEHNILAVAEDEKRIYVAVESPEKLEKVISEIEFIGGKTLSPYLALKCTLERSIRVAYRAIKNNQKILKGLWVVGEHDALPRMSLVASPVPVKETLKRQLREDINTDVRQLGLDDMDNLPTAKLTEGVVDSQETHTFAEQTHVHERPFKRQSPFKVLVVDDDLASRHLLVKLFQPQGVITQTASTGSEALKRLQEDPPDAVIMDVMLPEVDGFQVCRAIKKSKELNHLQVFLMSAVIGRGKVTEDVLRKHGADGYFEKPLVTEKVLGTVLNRLKNKTNKKKVQEQPGAHMDCFKQAMKLYRAGDVGAAVKLLRVGVEQKPLSAKMHFVLANLLHKEGKGLEAIEEYEVTCDLRPDYFPALSRLAYLYYENGYTLKAIETWRVSLSSCDDMLMKRKIEDFMQKLIQDMGQVPVASFG